ALAIRFGVSTGPNYAVLHDRRHGAEGRVWSAVLWRGGHQERVAGPAARELSAALSRCVEVKAHGNHQLRADCQRRWRNTGTDRGDGRAASEDRRNPGGFSGGSARLAIADLLRRGIEFLANWG